MRAPIVCTFLAGASFAALGCAQSPAELGHQAAQDDVRAPLCAFDVSAPEELHGALFTNDAPHLDCAAPAGGDTFRLGFAHGDWRLALTVPRGLNEPGDGAIPLDGGTVSLLFQGASGWCHDWTGDVTFASDLPAWKVTIDARCADPTIAPLFATFSGRDPR